MSGFLKRSTNTVNPAGGINPAQSPNVGQYGWTSYDAGNVNQLIEYVNICKQYADSAKESADYVSSKFGELQDFIDYIDVIYSQIGPIFDNIDLIYKDIVQKHKEVTTMHSDVKATLVQVLQSATDAHNSAMEAHGEAVKSEISAEESAASSLASAGSATESAASAKKAEDIAEELRKGQVYRGTWNIEEAAAFPPIPDTNSIWDITLKEGSVSYVFNGETWFWGDRLLYLKDDNKFSQIESGSGVISVNGKSGAVTLNAGDVGAIPTTGGRMTGKLQIYGASSQLELIENDQTADKVWRMEAQNNNLDFTESGAATRLRLKAGGGADLSGDLTVSGAKKVYHQGFKPTAADVGAVGNTGNQVMTGALAAVKYTASDTYAYVSSHRQYQGMYFDGPGINRRTIIGGGGEAVGDETGSVYIRPNGITDPTGQTVFQAQGYISNSVVPADSSHLTNKGYVDGKVKVAEDKIDAASSVANNAMPKSGGTFTGPVTLKTGVPSVLMVNETASISYQTFSGTIFHNYAADASSMAWSQGNAGENRLMTLTSGGQLSTEGPQFARYGQLAESRNGETVIGMEAPETSAPYISSKTPAESANSIALRFGQTEIRAESGKRISAETFRVSGNAGLRFSPNADFSGTSWGMGLDSSTERLGIHRYVNGSWASAPMEISKEGAVFFNANISTSGSLNANGGYIVATRPDNPMLELHSPGNFAGAIYLPGAGRMRFSQSNGAGGEAQMYAEFQGSSAAFIGCIRTPAKDASWGGWGDNVGGIQDLEGSRTINPGTWHPLITSSAYVDPLQGYAGRWSMGYYRPAAQHNGEVVINLNGDGFIRNNLRLVMSGAAQGRLYMDGTETGATWALQEGGQLYGSAFGSYGTMVNWCHASFAPLSDKSLKRNIKPATKSALDDVSQIEFKSYEWKEDAKMANMEPTKIGLVAQEMEAIDPSYTRDIQTFNPDGSVDTSVKGLDVTNMLALALKAIQEQQVQINELKEKLNEFIQQ